MTRVVISQPMYFPWIGMFEQMRLADVYVHYDDVQFSKGSFTNRVQVKTASGSEWMTIPLAKLHLGQKINEVIPDDHKDWRRQHRDLLARSFESAPFRYDALALFDDALSAPHLNVCEVGIRSMQTIAEYFDLCPNTQFARSSALGIAGTSSRRVLNIVKAMGGDIYITGHGARKYLDHELFEANGVNVEYIDYRKAPYPQQHGGFTPYVTALDLAANLSRPGRDRICSTTVSWRQFLEADAAR